MWTSIKRIIRSGFTHFYRSAFVSLAAVLIMAVTLFVIAAVVFLSAVLAASLDELKAKVDINVYFQTTAPEADILSLEKSLSALPEVRSVEYISRTEALENFKERHANHETILQALKELPDNPLGGVLTVRAYEPSAYASIVSFIRTTYSVGKVSECPTTEVSVLGSAGVSLIDEITYCDTKGAIDRLSAIIESAQTLGLTLSLLLVVISLSIAFNTIRLAIYISREEIGVMRLVGASNAYIRGPFIVSGVLYGAVAAVLTLAAYLPITYYLGHSTESFFSGLNLFTYYLAHFAEFFLIVVGSGVLLGAVSSFWAVRRYLHI